MKNNLKLYEDIANRTNGDIYIGVVGPVRTGKSTFIKNFMDLIVIPNIDDEHQKERTMDELPQSGSGKTIMTTEPKFIPNKAVPLTIDNNVKLKARFVDCVGYLVNNAIGYMENDVPRMVKTPWSKEEMPFQKAAEIGTKKVIQDHSTIGILVTTDGSFSGISRDDYILAEERVVHELTELNKPFVIILNSSAPYSEKTKELVNSLQEKYQVSVIPMDCAKLSIDNINEIFGKLLFEFPTQIINISYPTWIDALDRNHWLKQEILNILKTNFNEVNIIRQVSTTVANMPKNDIIINSVINEINLGSGSIDVALNINPNLFYKVLTEMSNQNISSEYELFSTFCQFSKIKSEYDRLSPALDEVRSKGYGIINPGIDDLILDEPEMVRQGSKYGVKLKAKAPSIHLIRTDVETEISPIVGSEKQSEDLVKYLLSQFEGDPAQIWQSNIFGRSLHELVNEGLQNKLSCMPEDAQIKLQQTLERIVNEGSGGLICIIL
ncbi:MAG: stage IV sporulation protein A [Bacilli bacterium]|nr:stage IV sporulation protein A [Bacilli bacterium]